MILQRYILKELWVHFIFTFATVMGVSLLGTTFQVFRAFEGLGLTLILKIAPLAAGHVAPWALLVAAATAATLVYGRMSAENEVTAMRACGIGSFKILAPALLFGLALSTCGYVLAEHVTPWSRHTKRVWGRDAILEVLRMPPPGVQRFSIGAYRLSYLDFKDGKLDKPSLLRFDKEHLVMEYHAPRGQIQIEGSAVKIVMSRPRYTQFDPKSGQEHRFEAQSDIEVPLEIQDYKDPSQRPEDLPQEELWKLYRTAPDKKKRDYARLIMHSRYAQSAAPLLLVLICAPIGIWVRKGSRLAGLGAALPPLLLYFIAFFVTQSMGENGRMAPLVAAWLPDAILALPGAVFLWRSRR
ncbi:MAG TPA: LptF/LptG family permease [Planctomycetota bacterium]